ncbi:MAG: TlpA disulfide reductase family protein [Bacteroidota bacterium]
MRYLCLLVLLVGCAPKPDVAPEEKPGAISLIFGAHPDFRQNLPEGIAQYVDDHRIKRSLRPNQTGDTLTIFTNREVLELTHTYPYQDDEDGPVTYSLLHFIVQQGDTVRFTYDRFKPHAEVLNRAVLPYDLNYNLASWEEMYERKVPVRLYMFEFAFDPNWTKEEEEANFLNHVTSVTQQDLDETMRENIFLDSLFNASLISEEAFTYHKTINYFRLMDRDMKRERVDRYVNQPAAEAVGEMDGIQSADYIPQLSIEALAFMGSMKYALSDYMAYRFQIPTVTETYDGSGLRYPDYPIKFDSTLAAEWLSQEVKESLLMDDLKGIMEQYPVAYRFRYLSKFKEFVSDTTMVNHITSEYAMDAGEEEEIILEDRDGSTQTFSEVLAMHAGKVVYVDWWAAWCGPCIQAMPELHALEDSFSGKEAVVLYVSIDEKHDYWQAAADTLLPDAVTTSYRVSNKFVSKQFEMYNIQYVPRYFLIDREGKVIKDYAPGPADASLMEMVAALLVTEL